MALNQYLCCPTSSIPTSTVKITEFSTVYSSSLNDYDLIPIVQYDSGFYDNKKTTIFDLSKKISNLTQTSSYSLSSQYSVSSSKLITSSIYYTELKEISLIDSASGFFNLTNIPISQTDVQLFVVGGGIQINSSSISTGIIADYKIGGINGNSVYFNNNFSNFGLSNHINTNDKIIVNYHYYQYL